MACHQNSSLRQLQSENVEEISSIFSLSCSNWMFLTIEHFTLFNFLLPRPFWSPSRKQLRLIRNKNGYQMSHMQKPKDNTNIQNTWWFLVLLKHPSFLHLWAFLADLGWISSSNPTSSNIIPAKESEREKTFLIFTCWNLFQIGRGLDFWHLLFLQCKMTLCKSMLGADTNLDKSVYLAGIFFFNKGNSLKSP